MGTINTYMARGAIRDVGKALVCQEAKGGQFSYYICGTLLKEGAGACQAPYLNSKKFENLVIDKIKERILTEENLRELVKLVNEEMDAASAESRQVFQVPHTMVELSGRYKELLAWHSAFPPSQMEL